LKDTNMLNVDPTQIEQNIHAWADEAGHDRGRLLVVMQKIQASYQSISEEAMRILAQEFQIQPAEVYSLATFFPAFSTQPGARYTFKMCAGSVCDLKQKEELLSSVQEKLGLKFGETSPDGLFRLEQSQCMGMCDQGPVLSVNGHVFTRMTAEKADAIVALCKQNQGIPTEPALWDGRNEMVSYEPIPLGSVVAGFARIAPDDLLDELISDRVISEDPRSLRSAFSGEPTSRTVLVCNTDLPRPGSYSERILLADHYDLFLEGMLACACLYGAREGIVYLRPEYEALRPVLVNYLEKLKGSSSGLAIPFRGGEFLCSVDVRTSPGFVAGGMGKALEIAVNGSRIPANDSSAGFDSVIALDVSTILEVGHRLAQKNRRPGPSQTEPTRIFSISGDCARPGVYELPRNTSLNDLLEVCGSQNPKAVQVGGTSGRFYLPAQFDRPLPAGDDGGEASLIVYGPDTDFRDVAIQLLEYNISQSCGYCAPCREGTVKLLKKYQTRKSGHGYSLLELNSIADCVRLSSKCEFGQNAVTGFQSLLQCFPELF
jgi:[NiFe] hydrogenase diaphorase moiety large subunit